MTRQREQLLRTTQRRMLRQIVGTRRRPLINEAGDRTLENWVDWIQRATREAEDAMCKFCISDWVAEVCKRKFGWAGHVCRRQDGRWSRQVLNWCPVGWRDRGHPLMRWRDSFTSFFDNVSAAMTQHIDWMALAEDRDAWNALEEQFVLHCSGRGSS